MGYNKHRHENIILFISVCAFILLDIRFVRKKITHIPNY